MSAAPVPPWAFRIDDQPTYEVYGLFRTFVSWFGSWREWVANSFYETVLRIRGLEEDLYQQDRRVEHVELGLTDFRFATASRRVACEPCIGADRTVCFC